MKTKVGAVPTILPYYFSVFPVNHFPATIITIIDQLESQATCTSISESGFAGYKRLLHRKEWVLAAAWDSTLSDATIDTIEDGLALPTTGHCNSNYASGITFDNLIIPANKETLSSTNSHDVRKVITGSNSTKNCVSRYGIQDMPGNVYEWNSDQINNGVGVIAASNTADNTNGDFNNGGALVLNFDDSHAPDSSGDYAGTFGGIRTTLRIQFPLAVPIASDAFSEDGIVDWTSTTSKFHSDAFRVDPTGLRGLLSGNNLYNGGISGRYAFRMLYSPTDATDKIGFRCSIVSPTF